MELYIWLLNARTTEKRGNATILDGMGTNKLACLSLPSSHAKTRTGILGYCLLETTLVHNPNSTPNS
uniref:Uncharacterized protein n=1 Tax=Anguilla anguilla TaxID=7936 RepID=A0A0E9VE83_ANGAN